MRLVAVALCAVSALAATRQTREASTIAAGTARIAGTVIDAQRQGVHGAIVTLTGAGLPTGRAAIAAADGSFTIDRLPAGRFQLSASKPAYLNASYGAVRPGGAGTAIVLGAGQEITGLSLTMPRGGVIAGTIRDPRGEPMPGMMVSVIPIGAREIVLARLREAMVSTDDRGAYRVFGLLPGKYVVAASRVTSGGLGEIGMMSTAEVDAALSRLRQRAAAGVPARTLSPERSPGSVVRPVHTFSATMIFFPGVPAASAAAPIALGLGEVRDGVDFVYQLARAAAVSGSISGAGSANVQLSLASEGASLPVPVTFGAGPMLQRRAPGDGPFTFTNVTPGKYRIIARTSAGTGPGGLRGAGASPTAPAAELLFSVASVDVNGDDIEGLSLALQPALHVTGRVTVQPGAGIPLADLTKTRIRLQPVSEVVGMEPTGVPMTTGAAAAVRADGTFDIAGVLPGTYQLAATVQPAGWWPKRAMLAGVDLLDVPLDMTSSDIAGVDITVSNQRSQIAGQLLQSGGTPASGYFVVAFSANRAYWTPQSRRLRSGRPGTDGRFNLDDLPAGEYYLAALTDADSDDWQSREFLEQVVAAAVKITLGDGERMTQDLRIARRDAVPDARRE